MGYLFCQNCGKRVLANFKHCPNCGGEKLSVNNSMQTQNQTFFNKVSNSPTVKPNNLHGVPPYTVLCIILIVSSYLIFAPNDKKSPSDNTVNSSDSSNILVDDSYSQEQKNEENDPNSIFKFKLEWDDRSDSGLDVKFLILSVQSKVDGLIISELKGNRGNCDIVPIGMEWGQLRKRFANAEERKQIESQEQEMYNNIKSTPLKFGQEIRYVVLDECKLLEINIISSKGNYNINL